MFIAFGASDSRWKLGLNSISGKVAIEALDYSYKSSSTPLHGLLGSFSLRSSELDQSYFMKSLESGILFRS